MASKYCINCGEKHDFTIDIPKFCSNCGTPFGGVAVASKQPAARKIEPSKQRQEIRADEDSEEDADKEVPQITKFEVEIEIDSTPKISFANAKNARSFSREKATKPLTESDLTNKLDSLFERDRQDQKDNK